MGHRPTVKGGYFPVPPIDSESDLRAEMLSTMGEMGLPIEKHHHEVAQSQHELGTKFASLLRAADYMQIYKYCVHNVAHSYGKTATFMPKPVHGDNGSGMHVHQSIWKDGRPTMAGNGYADLSETALHYIGGIIRHAKALNAFTNPSTNSYKRLIPGFEAPVLLAYSARNRSASCRIPFATSPKAKRVEVRFPDATANPYLAFAAMLMAGLDGIANKIDPGEPMDTRPLRPPRRRADAGSRPSADRCARRCRRSRPTTRSCSPATCSAATRSRPTARSSGRRCTASSTPRTRSSSRCITPSKACGGSSRVDDGGGEIDHGLEALVCLVGPHGDALELLQLAEEVLDQVAPLVEVPVERQRPGTSRVLRDDDLGAPRIEVGNDRIAIEGLVSDQAAKIDTVQQRRDADCVETVSRQQLEAHEVAQRIGESKDLGRHAALGAADGLILSPPFAPCP